MDTTSAIQDPFPGFTSNYDLWEISGPILKDYDKTEVNFLREIEEDKPDAKKLLEYHSQLKQIVAKTEEQSSHKVVGTERVEYDTLGENIQNACKKLCEASSQESAPKTSFESKLTRDSPSPSKDHKAQLRDDMVLMRATFLTTIGPLRDTDILIMTARDKEGEGILTRMTGELQSQAGSRAETLSEAKGKDNDEDTEAVTKNEKSTAGAAWPESQAGITVSTMYKPPSVKTEGSSGSP